MSNLEDEIKKMISAELDRRSAATELQPVAKFCKDKNISRVSLWRHEKQGKIKIVRIGSKLFINPAQFI